MPLERLVSIDNNETSLDTKQIYILDDDESVRRSLKMLMVSYGFSVITFSSAEEFFDAVPSRSPGCLILDIHLLGLNGWDVMERLSQEGSKLPVIVITADINERLKDRALKAGAVGFLLKPFEDHYLLHMVNKVFMTT